MISNPQEHSPPTPLELDYLDSDSDLSLHALSPDAPILSPSSPDTFASSFTPPRWLRRDHSQWPSWLNTTFGALAPFATYILAKLQPRLTWRYALWSLVAGYGIYCFLTGSHLLASKLPDYSGPYRVGAIDLEVPLPSPKLISNATIASTGDPALELSTILFTLYYPIDKETRSSKPRLFWFPKPLSLTAEGYLTLGHVNFFPLRQILTFALWLIAGSITIPAAVDTPLVSSATVPTALPIQVFSHGMASSRTDYTHYLGQLASHGHVLAAIEHRDGSSPGSYVNTPNKLQRKVLPLRKEDLRVGGGEIDTDRLKFEQLAFREAEIYATVSALQRLNKRGDLDVTRGTVSVFETFRKRLDFSRLTIGGHSYGATGALQALKPSTMSAHRSLPVEPIGGVILDPGKSSGRLNSNINVPLLVIHSDSWSKSHSIFYGRPHFETVKELVQRVMERTSRRASWFLTSLGTSHPSVTDAPLLEPSMLSWTTGATLNVGEALHQYVDITLHFLAWLEEKKELKDLAGVLGEAVTHNKYGQWVSDKRRKNFANTMARFWEIHVSPVKS